MKTKILKALKGAEGFLSGQQLCETMGVSRTAVWKVIEQLREEGYRIDSIRSKGYRLIDAPDVYSESGIKSRLHTKKLGQTLLYFDKLDSTNLFCRKMGENYPDGTLVIANVQTAGRGSRGRGWESPGDVSIYMTLILKPDLEPQKAPALTPVMALSIVRALEQLGVAALVKWPNDVVINGRKLAGILTEMNAETGYIHQLMIGVGINVLADSFPQEIAPRATSLLIETGRTFSRAELVARIMDCFEEDYSRFMETGDLSQLLEQYTQYSATIGREVRVLDRKGEYTGTAVRVDADGQLYVQREDGSCTVIYADEVSVRGLYGYA